MLGSGFNKQKLKVNLKLAINRLKLLEKKKSKFVFIYILSWNFVITVVSVPFKSLRYCNLLFKNQMISLNTIYI